MFQNNLFTLKQLNELVIALLFNLGFTSSFKLWNAAKISSQHYKVSQFQQFLYIHFRQMKLQKLFGAWLRACVYLLSVIQDSTITAARSNQGAA